MDNKEDNTNELTRLKIEKLLKKNKYWQDKIDKWKVVNIKSQDDEDLIIELTNEILYNSKRIQELEKVENKLNGTIEVKEMEEKIADDFRESLAKKNRGIGAGGANTNLHGKKFEEQTNIENYLLEKGFEKTVFSEIKKNKYDYTLSKTFDGKKIIYLSQNGFKTYMKKYYNIDAFRCPDEAYVIKYKDGRKIIKVLEKKEQNVDGSVETKLWACPSLKREYEIVLNTNDTNDNFIVYYALCVNDFLYKSLTSDKQKYQILRKILQETDVTFFQGDVDNYFERLYQWLLN